MKLCKFVNFSDEAFGHPSLSYKNANGEEEFGKNEECQWAKEPYFFPPRTSQVMEDWKAAHFAKHFTNRELLKQPKGEYHTSPKQDIEGKVDDAIFLAIYNKALVPIDMQELSPQRINDRPIEKLEVGNSLPKPAVFCTQCDSKGVRHKKGCPTLLAPKKTAESEFQGI